MQIIRRAILAFALVAGITPAFAQAPPPVPALPDTERRTSYSISASTCACAVGFQLYGDSTDVANWLTVFVNGVQVLQPGNWTITSPSGSLATLPRPISDAVLTFTTAQTGVVQIVGAQRPRRLSEYAENRGVAARDLNQTMNSVEAQLRELWDRQFRTVQAPPGETLNLLPKLSGRASMNACFDSNGNLTSCVSSPSGSFAAGNGITFTGTNPTTISTPTYAAGTGIVFTGSNPTVISASGSGSAFIASRAIAATLDLHLYGVIQTGGYATAGDGGGATFKNVGSAPFLDSFISTGTVAGGTGYTNGVYYGIFLTGGTGIGAIAVVTVAGGVVTSVNLAGSPGNAYTVGDVLTASNAVIGGTGSGFTYTVTAVTTSQASFTDSVGTHFQFVVDQSAYPNVRQFGARMNWDGVDANATDDFTAFQAALRFTTLKSGTYPDSGGYFGGKLLVPRGSMLLCGTGLASIIVPQAVNVVGAGTYATTLKMCDAFNAATHFIELCDPNWRFACFNSGLSQLDVFANRNVAANNQVAMVHTNATQHDGGLSHVVIYAGQRMGTFFEKGYGGASAVTYEFVELSGAGTNIMAQFGNTVGSGLNYGSTIFNLRNVVLGGPSSGNLQTAPGIMLLGGFYDILGVHCELIPVCIEINIPSATSNGDIVRAHNINAGGGPPGSACTGTIQLDATNRLGNTIVGMVPAGSCTNVVTNGQPSGSNRTTAIILDIVFNP